MAAENVRDGIVEQVHWNDVLDGEVDRELVDCRPREMRDADGHVPRSSNVPLPELRERVEELPDEVAAYCKMGQSSYMATRVLEQHGIDAVNFAGGYTLYEAVHRDRNARDARDAATGDD
jgi:rhodanese-related sulfurtransferase